MNILGKGSTIEIIFQLSLRVLGFKLFLILPVIFCFLNQICGDLCPVECECDNKERSTVCTNGELKYIPQLLPPSIKELKINCNRIKKIDGTLNYYDKVRLSTYTKYCAA